MKKLHEKRKKFLINKSKRTFQTKVKRNRAFRKVRVANNPLLSNRGRQYGNNGLLPIEKQVITISANPSFSLFKHTENVIGLIRELKSYRDAASFIQKIQLDLGEVISIDLGAINLLLSTVKELGVYGVLVEGNLPKNPKCKEKIIDSGYLEHMASISKDLKKSMNLKRSENLILLKGKDKTENAEVGKCIKLAMKELIGVESHFPPVYTIIQEMNGNSVEHAYSKKGRQHWLLGVNHIEKEGKIAFTFTDNGRGIISTLERRFSKKVFDTLGLKSHGEILAGIFEKKYNSRFKSQINRNKGLPVIKKAQDSGLIKNLSVLTNGVSYNLSKNKVVQLDNEFSGTFYYWEIDEKIVTKWKKSG